MTKTSRFIGRKREQDRWQRMSDCRSRTGRKQLPACGRRSRNQPSFDVAGLKDFLHGFLFVLGVKDSTAEEFSPSVLE